MAPSTGSGQAGSTGSPRARRPRPASRDRAGSQPRRAASPGRRPPVALAAFLAAVFAIKLIAVLQLEDHILLQPDAGLDTTIYVTMAERVLNGDLSLGPGLYFISPLYIYFLAFVLAVARSFTAVRIFQIVLGTAGVAMIFTTARIWFGPRAAWLAATLAAMTGLFTFYEVLLLQAAIDPVLTAAALACLAVALTRDSRLWFVFAGMAFGIQTLNRPNVLIAAAGIAFVIALTRRPESAERVSGTFQWRAAAALAFGVLIGLAPVTIRNLVVAGDWSPVSSHGGLNFYIGNNADADGTYHGVPGISPTIEGQQHDARKIAEQKIGRSLSDAEVSAYFYGQGADWIRAHPRDAAVLSARKIAYTFNSAHLWLNFSLPFYANDMRTVLRWLAVGPWLLIPLGVFGLALHVLVSDASSRKAYLPWLAFVPFYALAVAVFFASERYRLPLLIPFCAGAGAAIDWLIAIGSQRNVRALAISIALLAGLFVGANWSFGLDNGLAEERTRMAERLIMLDRFDEAAAWAARAEPLYPHPAVMHFRLGRRLLLGKHPERALPHLRKAEELQPGQAEVAYALGQALLDTKQPMEAIPYLRRAYEAGVRSDLAGFDLARAHAATGNRQAALAVLQNVRPADPKDAASWHGLGQLALDLEAPRLAEAFFRRAIDAKPDAAATHGQLGLTLAFMGRYQEAIREMQEAVRLDPKSASARLNLAVSLAEVGRMKEARALATEALSLDPNYERARQFLGAIAGK